MTREELRDYVDEQRTLDNIPYHVYSALIDGIDTLEQEPRWIPTSERLPEEHNGYLVSMKKGYVTTALWVGNAEYWNEVTAWMPLPKAYSEVKE